MVACVHRYPCGNTPSSRQVLMLRKELDNRHPAHVPEAPIHESLRASQGSEPNR